MCLVFETLGKSLYDFIKENKYKGTPAPLGSLRSPPYHIFVTSRVLSGSDPVDGSTIPSHSRVPAQPRHHPHRPQGNPI
jgi:hypothetical protein